MVLRYFYGVKYGVVVQMGIDSVGTRLNSFKVISTFITSRLYLRTFCDIRLDTEHIKVTEGHQMNFRINGFDA